MCGVTPRLDRWGDPVEDEDPGDDITRVPSAPGGCPEKVFSTGRPSTRDEIHTERCAELRRILKDARDRREAQR